jgi:hypothetical protein
MTGKGEESCRSRRNSLRSGSARSIAARRAFAVCGGEAGGAERHASERARNVGAAHAYWHRSRRIERIRGSGVVEVRETAEEPVVAKPPMLYDQPKGVMAPRLCQADGSYARFSFCSRLLPLPVHGSRNPTRL